MLPVKLAVLMTCFNRKALTTLCLESLLNQVDINGVQLQVYLVDDGCTDGTAEHVQAHFPRVEIVQGNGSLYWNGGMRLAWQTAISSGNDYNFYLWLNDDVQLNDDALKRLLAEYVGLIEQGAKVGAVLGSMCNSQTRNLSFGGRLRAKGLNPLRIGELIDPNKGPVECDFLNGNFVLVPSESVAAIGILSEVYTHGMGDFDYGLRLQRAGLKCWVACGLYGVCDESDGKGGFNDPTLSIAKRVQKMKLITQLPPVREWMHFSRQHGGVAWPLLWVNVWFRSLFPRLWLYLRGR